MLGRLGAALLPAFAALLALPLAGCSSTTTSSSSTSSNEIVIGGQVTIKGNLRGTVRVSATPVPGPVEPLDELATQRTLRIVQPQTAYRFEPLPRYVDYRATITERAYGRVTSTRKVRKAYVIDHYDVKVEPPRGWSVAPPSRDVSANTSAANFVLQRKPAARSPDRRVPRQEPRPGPATLGP